MTSLIRNIYALLLVTQLLSRGAFGAALALGAVGTYVATAVGASTAGTSGAFAQVGALTAVATGGAVPGAILTVVIPVGITVGLCFLGAEHDNATIVSWDCWKPLLHDRSQEPSHGRLVNEVLADPRVKLLNITEEYLLLSNIWNEVFRVDFFGLPDGECVAHATSLKY